MTDRLPCATAASSIMTVRFMTTEPVFDQRQEAGLRSLLHRRAHLHHAPVQRGRRALAELLVQCRRHVLRRAEVGIVQFHMDVAVARERGGHAALDNGARADAAAVQLVDLHAGTARGSAGPAHQDVALGDGVDLAVRALHGRHQQGAAAQALGVAHRRHHHVQRLAGPGERGQGSRDHDRRHVLQLHVAAGGHVCRTWSPLPSKPTTRP
ncbi:hypothetical protein G6F57_018988 [Rhizopus arrhizus]|nr:hypothetical protein G6F57_018988 [Rhizopus arrhizus]